MLGLSLELIPAQEHDLRQDRLHGKIRIILPALALAPLVKTASTNWSFHRRLGSEYMLNL